jgi:hypothetical protein
MRNPNPLEKRRTLIPILLSCGLILIFVGTFVLLSGPETAMSDLFPTWAAITLLVLGGVTLMLTGINMLYVQQHAAGLKKRF